MSFPRFYQRILEESGGRVMSYYSGTADLRGYNRFRYLHVEFVDLVNSMYS